MFEAAMSRGEPKSLSRRDVLFGLVNRFRGAPEKGRNVAGIDPDLLQAESAIAGGDYAAAVTSLRACLAKSPEQAQARAKLGYCLYKGGRHIQAACELNRVLKKKDDNFSALYLGLVQARLGRLDAAVAAWKRYFNPDLPTLQRELNLQMALIASETPPTAEEVVASIETAIADCPDGLAS